MGLALKSVHDWNVDATPVPHWDEPPLVLDLDRCLLRADMLLESALNYLRPNPLRAFKLMFWALRGRAQLKRRLAEVAPLDLSLLPANEQLVAFAEAEKKRGRRIYLATAADELLALRAAKRFPFIDGVVSSDGNTNLKGAIKAQFLALRFPNGFDYAGDSAADLPVWKEARHAIAVEPRPAVERAVRALGKPVTVLDGVPLRHALQKSLRLHQWAKNALVFVPAVLGGKIGEPSTIITCALAFLAIGLVASATYLINDLWDLAADRQHWSKRERPLASGALPIEMALATCLALLAGGLAIAAFIGLATFLMLAAYLATTLAYSFYLKRVPILDGFVLAGLFTLRIAIGIAAAAVFASPWLLVFSMFLFGSLSFAKRHTELSRVIAANGQAINGRGYIAADAPLLLALGLATGTASILIMVLYLINDAFGRGFYGNAHWLWALPAMLFLWIARVWLVGQRGKLDDDPVAFAMKDRLSLVLGGCVGAAFICAWIGVPL
jgi:4-hydroxybenzoate polyprenyltransferase